MKQENESLIGLEVGDDMVIVHHHRDGTDDTHELVPHAMGWGDHIKPDEKV